MSNCRICGVTEVVRDILYGYLGILRFLDVRPRLYSSVHRPELRGADGM